MALMLAGVEGNNVTQEVPSEITMHFLIPNNHMGSIIGRGGQKIKEIQTTSNVHLKAQEQPLPGSTERQLSATGLPDGLHIAVMEVGHIILNNSERSAGTI